MQFATKPRLALIILACAAIIFAATSSYTSSANAALDSASVSVVSSNNNGIQFALALPSAEINADGKLTVAGLDSGFSEPGTPDLPFYSTLIALPPNATAQVALSVSGQTERAIETIRPISNRVINDDTDIFANPVLEDLEEVFEPNAEIYEANEIFPTVRYEVSDPMYIRDVRVVQIKLFPVRYNPVAQTLTEVDQFDVGITFAGGTRDALNPASGETQLPTNVLNAAQAAEWRSLPSDLNSRATGFPIGKQTLKITVDKDGIYELSYADLDSAGLDVDNINPATLEMMYQNEPVAYQFIGDADTMFEPNEAIRFYGWAFDGSIHDQLFVGDENVFWLWADGTPTLAATTNNGSAGTVVTEWRSTVELDDERFYTPGESLHYQDNTNDNEPDAWYLVGMSNGVTETFSIELPDVVTSGSNADVLVEVSTVNDKAGHVFDVALNTDLLDTFVWDGWDNRNLTASASASTLQDGTNLVKLYSHRLNGSGNTDTNEKMLVNRIQVMYDRELTAVDDQLQFTYPTTGNQIFQVGGFTTADPDDIMAWDVASHLLPTIVTLTADDITPAAGNNTVNLGLDYLADTEVILTTQTMSPKMLELYTADSLEPASGSAEWVAIAHANFMAGANDLAQHRVSFSSLTTQVVDVEDVYNQYGYGLARPEAIQEFFTHALANWGMQYGLLVGDATENPLKRDCIALETTSAPSCPQSWSTTDENYVLTDFQFIDRFAGMVPSDHTFTTVVGGDELEDFAIGRLTGGTAAEIQKIVDKIKLYEAGLRNNESWSQNMIWLADNADEGGPFCAENASIRQGYVGESLNHEEICLDDVKYAGPNTEPSEDDKRRARTDFQNLMFSDGARIINYRGHGSIDDWASGWISIGDEWANEGRPSVILSADCLDGSFYKSGRQTLGEAFLSLDKGRGTAAHWSSSGLGFSREHTVLHRGFYQALYDNDMTRIGDAIQSSKNNYITTYPAGHISEPYSFKLQGDPAMIVVSDGVTPDEFKIFLPAIQR